jgi:hypothetical protein
MARRAEDLPPSVVVIEDDFSAMTDDEYRDALARWLAELDEAEPIELDVTAADTLRDIRDNGEA